MITERQEQIKSAMEVLHHAEDYLKGAIMQFDPKALPNYRAIDLLANLQTCDLLERLRLELVIEWEIEWDQIEAELQNRLYCELHAQSRAALDRLYCELQSRAIEGESEPDDEHRNDTC